MRRAGLTSLSAAIWVVVTSAPPAAAHPPPEIAICARQAGKLFPHGSWRERDAWRVECTKRLTKGHPPRQFKPGARY
jgi:hypothetical protein